MLGHRRNVRAGGSGLGVGDVLAAHLVYGLVHPREALAQCPVRIGDARSCNVGGNACDVAVTYKGQQRNGKRPVLCSNRHHVADCSRTPPGGEHKQ